MPAMKWLDSLSAPKLAILGGAGNASVLLAAVAAFAGLSRGFIGNTSCWTFAVVGYALMMVAERRLRQGIADERWPDGELEPLRRFVDRPLLKAARVVLTIPMLVASGFLPGRNAGALVLLGIFSLGYKADVKAALTRPKPAPPRVDWTSAAAPIQSEHWGERGMPLETNGLG